MKRWKYVPVLEPWPHELTLFSRSPIMLRPGEEWKMEIEGQEVSFKNPLKTPAFIYGFKMVEEDDGI